MRRSPQRSCIGCRAVREKRSLVRLVHTPDHRFSVDPGGKTAGRGAYLCPDPACLEAAVRRKGLDRAFRQTVSRDTVAALEECFRAYLRARTGNGAAPGTEAEDGALD